MKKIVLQFVLLGLVAALPLSAQAIYMNERTAISWRGTCHDCVRSGDVVLPQLSVASAELLVDDTGNAAGGGTDLSDGNLAAFTYFSELFPYGIFANSSDITSASGIIPAAPNTPAEVLIEFLPLFGYAGGNLARPDPDDLTPWSFATHLDGSWQLLNGLIVQEQGANDTQDFGAQSRFNVPEPGSLALLSLGLVGLRMRRKDVACNHAAPGRSAAAH